MPVPVPPKSRPLLRRLILTPWSLPSRRSPAVRRWCDRHGYITPHFTWASYACQDGTPVPTRLRRNAIRLHGKLELFRHRLGDQPMTVDGPYRTDAHNRQVGGAPLSRHVQADAADFFAAQVTSWADGCRRKGESTGDAWRRVLAIADRTFYNGGLGNENTGTLHVDARGFKARFETWRAAR